MGEVGHAWKKKRPKEERREKTGLDLLGGRKS